MSDIDFVDSFGNKKEQLYYYTYKKEFDLIVWNISGYKDVELTDIKFFASDDFESIAFNPMRYTEMSFFKVSSKSENLEIDTLTAYTNKEFEVINRFQNDSIWYLNIYSKGLALGNLREYKIKIESSINYIYNFAFIKNTTGFQIIVLTSKNGSELREDLPKWYDHASWLLLPVGGPIWVGLINSGIYNR